MKTVFKYRLELVTEQVISLPVGAQILTAQVQFENLCLWALVDPNPEIFIEQRKIYINGTGHEIHHFGKYINTVQIAGGNLVFHIFSEG